MCWGLWGMLHLAWHVVRLHSVWHTLLLGLHSSSALGCLTSALTSARGCSPALGVCPAVVRVMQYVCWVSACVVAPVAVMQCSLAVELAGRWLSCAAQQL